MNASIHRCLSIAACCAAVLLISACSSTEKPGVADLPPLPPAKPGDFTDINPRWSHDGTRIAFLRSTPDRRLQLHTTDGDLETPSALLEPEVVSPDRLYESQQARYSSPDTIAWSPDDRHIAFERSEWFRFDDGQRLPGTAIWSFDLRTGRVSALALHPDRYTNLFYYYHTPAWSPDGRYVSFVAEGINGQRLIGLRCVGVEKPKEVAPRFDNYQSSDWPTWRNSSPYTPGVRSQPVLAYAQSIFRTPSVPITASLRAIQPGSASRNYCRELWRMRPAQYSAAASVRERSDAGDVVEPRVGHLAWSPNDRMVAYTLTPDANDYSRYEIWVLDVASGSAHRVGPRDQCGYLAPEWIDNETIGALCPVHGRFDVVAISVARGTRRLLGEITTADCDWAPDHRRIVYATPPSPFPHSAGVATTLRMLDIHVAIRSGRNFRVD